MTLPQKLGKYEIRRELGSGAMGIVYEGWDPMIARRVAIKTVRKEQLDRSEADEVLARFQREAQAAGRLTHPNIVAVYEFGDDAGTAFIAMEFIEGKELKDYFDNDERFPLPKAIDIMEQLLGALDVAHKNGVVHRDIKPANIILLADGTVKVADFGIARIESSNLTQAGSVLGTPSYMSPEQFMGQQVDGRSDLYSAGVILYQFLTGEKPFTGALTTIMHKVLNEEPPAPSILNVQVPRRFDAVVKKAMAKRPDERFTTGKAFIEALKAAAAAPATADADATVVAPNADATVVAANIDATVVAGKVDATVLSAPGAAPRPVAPPPPPAPGVQAPLPHATPAAAKSSKGLVFALAGVAALAVVGGGAYMLMGKSSAPSAGGESALPGISTPAVMAKAVSDTLTITAMGIADPSDPRFKSDQGALNQALREDLKRQLIEKAAALYLSRDAINQNYPLIQAKLLSRGGEFIQGMQEEQAPSVAKDGLAYITAKATVDVRKVQKTLNQMSNEDRVDFIRNNGDPKISVAITAKSADGDQNGPAPRSPVAENLLKEKIQAFGFRVWNDEAKDAADFAVSGEAKFKKLSAKLEASGITIEKYVLTSWTVKATDKKSGEEIYHNTQIPEQQSWATEDAALRDIGKLVAEEFSKNFFLKHFRFSGQKVKLNLKGVPNKETAQALLKEFMGMRPVLTVSLATTLGSDYRYDAELSGDQGPMADQVQAGLLQPLNAKFGKTCLAVTGSSGDEVSIAFEPSCNDAKVLGRLDSMPPAALMGAPKTRLESLTRNPEMLRKLSI